jgi:hypothetical protein
MKLPEMLNELRLTASFLETHGRSKASTVAEMETRANSGGWSEEEESEFEEALLEYPVGSSRSWGYFVAELVLTRTPPQVRVHQAAATRLAIRTEAGSRQYKKRQRPAQAVRVTGSKRPRGAAEGGDQNARNCPTAFSGLFARGPARQYFKCGGLLCFSRTRTRRRIDQPRKLV